MNNKLVYAFLTADNIPFYIGMGSIDRCKNHKKGSRNWRWWEMMKANKDYKFIIVDRSLTKQQAWDIEIDLIKEFGCEREGGILTNVHPGGSWYSYSNKNNKIVVQFSLDGKKIKEWENYQMADEALNPKYRTGNILNCCKGRVKSYYEYQWFFKSEVGDVNSIIPVDRQGEYGGNSTGWRKFTRKSDGKFFKSKRACIRETLNENGNWNWKKIKHLFEEIDGKN